MRKLLCKSEYKKSFSMRTALGLLTILMSLISLGLLAGCDASGPTEVTAPTLPSNTIAASVTTTALYPTASFGISPSATSIVVPSTEPATMPATPAYSSTVLPFTPTAIIAPTPTAEGATVVLSPTPVRSAATPTAQPLLITPQADFAPDEEERLFVSLLNQYRASKGVASLTFEPILWRSARWMAQDMAVHNVISHTDSQGRNIQTRIKAFGFGGGWTGENIAGGFQHAADNLAIWQSDDIHNNNLLGTHYTKVGVGRFYSQTAMNHWNWVLDLGN